jgi:hypothetical protein
MRVTWLSASIVWSTSLKYAKEPSSSSNKDAPVSRIKSAALILIIPISSFLPKVFGRNSSAPANQSDYRKVTSYKVQTLFWEVHKI